MAFEFFCCRGRGVVLFAVAAGSGCLFADAAGQRNTCCCSWRKCMCRLLLLLGLGDCFCWGGDVHFLLLGPEGAVHSLAACQHHEETLPHSRVLNGHLIDFVLQRPGLKHTSQVDAANLLAMNREEVDVRFLYSISASKHTQLRMIRQKVQEFSFCCSLSCLCGSCDEVLAVRKIGGPSIASTNRNQSVDHSEHDQGCCALCVEGCVAQWEKFASKCPPLHRGGKNVRC